MKLKISTKQIISIILALVIILSQSGSTMASAFDLREDGLVISETDSEEVNSKDGFEYLTMIIKTGYAHEPQNKLGLNNLTTELVYFLLRYTSALEVNYNSFADFTVFNFILAQNNFEQFCSELDTIIRLDTLLLYDLCNELIRFHSNNPEYPYQTGEYIMYKMLYGENHPYLNRFKEDYSKLDINDVNNWFRKIYKPNNIIISTTAKIPKDFLKKPNGRDMEEEVLFETIPTYISPRPNHNFSEVRDELSTVFFAIPAPKLYEEDFFAGLLFQRHLEKALWMKLRQNMGLCYDIQVNYSYLNEPSAPKIIMAFKVLPEDTKSSITEVFKILKKMEKVKLSPEELNYLVKREEKSEAIKYDSNSYLTAMNAFKVLYNVEWVSDYNVYISELKKITPEEILDFSKTKLSHWQLSVVGPSKVSNQIEELFDNQEVDGEEIK